jgi:hypothetical protein
MKPKLTLAIIGMVLDVPAGTTAFRSNVPAPANCPGIH